MVFVHCETTTGLLNPLEELASLGVRYDISALVDAMSSFAVYEIDMVKLGIDASAASSNKCLEGLPWLSFVIARKSIIEASQGNSTSHILIL